MSLFSSSDDLEVDACESMDTELPEGERGPVFRTWSGIAGEGEEEEAILFGTGEAGFEAPRTLLPRVLGEEAICVVQ